jgi:hypothetical protein
MVYGRTAWTPGDLAVQLPIIRCIPVHSVTPDRRVALPTMPTKGGRNRNLPGLFLLDQPTAHGHPGFRSNCEGGPQNPRGVGQRDSRPCPRQCPPRGAPCGKAYTTDADGALGLRACQPTIPKGRGRCHVWSQACTPRATARLPACRSYAHVPHL